MTRISPRIERRQATGGGEDTTEEAEDPEAETDTTETTATETSIADLTTEADPNRFDQTFTSDAASLNIEGEFDPVAGTKQVIPRVAYVISYQFVYNEERGRWEPKKKGNVIDDFEDGNISEYSGDTGTFQVVEQPDPFQGDFYLEATTNGPFFTIAARDGLPRFPERGDTFLVQLEWTNGTDVENQVRFFTQDETGNPDGYIVGIQGETKFGRPDEFFLRKRSGGSRTELNGTSFDPDTTEGQEMTLEVQTFDRGAISATLSVAGGRTVAEVRDNDTEFDTGGVGFAVSAGTSTAVTCRWDDARFET